MSVESEPSQAPLVPPVNCVPVRMVGGFTHRKLVLPEPQTAEARPEMP